MNPPSPPGASHPTDWAIIATIALGLAADQEAGTYGQAGASFAAWVLFGWLLVRASPAQRAGLLACLVYAALGEVFLSLVWRLYEYRLHNIPMYVQPGHVLLFALGARIAARVPGALVWVIFAAAAAATAYLALTGADTLGPLLLGLLLLCLLFGPARKLYATMFVLALAMELYGTWLGNWAWSRDVPWLDLRTANPPMAAGAFYCVLDLLVLATMRGLQRAPLRRAERLLPASAAGKS